MFPELRREAETLAAIVTAEQSQRLAGRRRRRLRGDSLPQLMAAIRAFRHHRRAGSKSIATATAAQQRSLGCIRTVVATTMCGQCMLQEALLFEELFGAEL